ncbi:MAG: insulinase family protein [Verrucomicrobiae bacterium]|nr:insulinase family protein [Verrucomicrobiae bacterium]
MKSHRLTRHVLLTFLCGLLPVLSHAQATKPAPDPVPLAQDGSDIPVDPAVTWGVLDNGLRYAILPNSEPPNRVSLRLYVDAGSLMETDSQQGLAHFLEHMAFNGTKEFPAGEMVEYFQRLGMGFGSHTNAHTSFHETVYKLELPGTESALLNDAFKLLRDYADGMLLGEKEIEKERGVILKEKLSRDSVGWRTMEAQLKFILDKNLVSNRLPIGTEEVIKGAPRQEFVDFYRKWYTPDRMVVIAVGQVEVPQIEALVKQYFASVAPAEMKSPEPDLSHVNQRGVAVHFHPEKEAGEVSISIDTIKPRSDTADNTESRARRLRIDLANQIISRRISKLAKAEDSPIISGSAYAYDLYDLNFADYAGIEVSTQPQNWEKGLDLAEQELRRAIEHGFTAAELEEAKANVRNRAEVAAKSMATRKSSDLADTLAARIGERRVFTSPANDLPRVTKELDAITADQCRDLLRGIWDGSHEVLLLVTGNVEIPDAQKTILASYQKSQAVAVEPPAKEEQKAFAYADLPAPGEITERKAIDDLGVIQLRFANNVRANLKVTDFEDAAVYVKARFGGGTLTEPKNKPGIAFFSGHVFTEGGLEAHDIDDIRRLFAGKAVNAGFSVADDAFSLSGKTTPEDVHDQLLLMRAYLTNPGYRGEAAGQLQRALDQFYQQIQTTPEGVLQNEVDRFLHGGDSRFGFPPKDALAALTMDDTKSWLGDALAKDYLEITVVGDFDPEKMIGELAATFGNLPERAAAKPDYAAERQVTFPKNEAAKTFTFETSIPKAMSLVYWPTADIFDIQRTRRIGLLGAILDDRLRIKIREELGDAYSPFAHNIPSDAFKDYGYLLASVIVDPPQAQKVTGVIQEIGAELAKGDTITQDELDRAKKPQITEIEEYRRTNRYWLSSVLESSQEYPQRLDWARTFVSDYEAITLDEIKALAKEYLAGHTGLGVVVTPTGGGDAPKKGAAESAAN